MALLGQPRVFATNWSGPLRTGGLGGLETCFGRDPGGRCRRWDVPRGHLPEARLLRSLPAATRGADGGRAHPRAAGRVFASLVFARRYRDLRCCVRGGIVCGDSEPRRDARPHMGGSGTSQSDSPRGSPLRRGGDYLSSYSSELASYLRSRSNQTVAVSLPVTRVLGCFQGVGPPRIEGWGVMPLGGYGTTGTSPWGEHWWCP